MTVVHRSTLLIRGTVFKISHKQERFFSFLKGHIGDITFTNVRPNHARHILSTRVVSNRLFSSGTNSLNMRFVQFAGVDGGRQRLGVQLTQEGDIIDVSGVDHSIPSGLVQFLRGGPELLERARRIVAEGKSLVPYTSVRLLPPIIAPDKVVCVGLNYRGHCEEQNLPFPKEPMFFSKFSSCITGPFADVPYPSVTHQLDWEVELAVVIGKLARDVRVDRAMSYVFGFTVAQDLSARDWQKERNNGQFLLGKAMDNFCPLGPAVVTKEAIPDPHSLGIRCKVNGVLKQDGNTSELIHRIDHIVSFFSHVCTLLPGDIILTGTPAGVGMHRNPQEFLKPGDVLESEIDGIGKLKNTIVGSNS